jgi:uncharacterized protein (DUF2236 family)
VHSLGLYKRLDEHRAREPHLAGRTAKAKRRIPAAGFVAAPRETLQPKDEGLLGPDAVAWRVIGHPGSMIGALRCLIIQSLHPLAMAGVAQHSQYVAHPIGRLHRTAYYVAATAFGDLETAYAAVAHVRRRHARVKGSDPITGQPYSAEEPATQIWVHSTEWHSWLAAYRVFGGGLSPEEEDRYFAEGAVIGSLLGTPQDRIPASVAAMRAYFDRVRPQLCVSEATRAAIEFVTRPRPTRDLLRYYPVWRVCSPAAVALVPRHLRRLAGIDRAHALDATAVATARSLLHVPFTHQISAEIVGAEAIALVKSRRRSHRDRANARTTERPRAA